MSTGDTELLNQLGQALATVPSTPTREEVGAFRGLVGASRRPTSTVAELTSRPARRRVRRAALAAALAATLVLGGGAVALATGGPFSGVARRAASAIGLPVDSPELSNAKNALAGLRGALAGHDARRIVDARQDVDRRLAALSGDDANEVSPEARALLREADERLGGDHDSSDHAAAGAGGDARNGSSADDRGSRGTNRGSGRGTESSPNVGPSGSGSGSQGDGATAPTVPSGGSGGSGNGGGSGDGAGSDGGSGADGGSGSGH
jgi:hypothetical protein